MISYNVKADLDSIKEVVSYFEFVGGNTSDAVRIAISKTVPIAKTRIAKAITNRVNLSAKYVKGKIQFKKASRNRLNGRVFVNSEGTSLARYEFSAKTSLFGKIVTPDTPIRVKILKGGPIKTVTGDRDTYGKPFLFRLKGRSRTDGNGLSYGIGGWRKTPGPKGGRIKMFLAPSVSQEFDEARDERIDGIADKYQSELLNAMTFILKKKHPKE